MPKCSSWGRFQRLVHALRQAISALSPNFEKFFCGVKVWCGAQKIGVGLQEEPVEKGGSCVTSFYNNPLISFVNFSKRLGDFALFLWVSLFMAFVPTYNHFHFLLHLSSLRGNVLVLSQNKVKGRKAQGSLLWRLHLFHHSKIVTFVSKNTNLFFK